MKAAEFKTVDDIRNEAESEFDGANPRPELPEPPRSARPTLVGVGSGAHVWIEVIAEPGGYHHPARARAQFFIVEREHGKDQRIQGELRLESVEGLIEELTRVKEVVIAKQAFLDATAEYEKQLNDWEKARAEFARHRVADWERAQGAKKGNKS